ncbi:16S rRNA (guanine(527)-N(7))-methyltransferase RsmG [Sulfurirhabdus autotrophica]|uniref:Ribosomal RNA small subunit methyltransferase G n=1 Tax=Sulfurirhabdus autotrophica TaxID=1706046 RepID=A0A4R3XU48_9PROT|nr:16S rRNA (guanine(527)-N(7))-methyltransferase RsmG [Sulfurirhabdus autotrophica]TCV82231.1 16S rRNA m(7)G-527 methyltransferase [Sulfurirhabdus autotrophica]
MTLEAKLAEGLREMDITLSSDIQEKLLSYLGLLLKWNKVYNLTAIREPEKMVSHHLLDSLSVIPYINGKRLLDVGSGAGLPGIPLAIVMPELEVVVLDSNHKKTTFAQQASIELGLGNVSVVCERVENWHSTKKFDMVISRAFSDMGEFYKLTQHLVDANGVFLAMKGLYPFEEMAQLPPEAKVLDTFPLSVPGLDAQRHLVVIKAN